MGQLISNLRKINIKHFLLSVHLNNNLIESCERQTWGKNKQNKQTII